MKGNNKSLMKMKMLKLMTRKTCKWMKKMVWKSKRDKTKNLLSLNLTMKIWKSNNKTEKIMRNKKCHRKRKVQKKTIMINSTKKSKGNKTNKIKSNSTHKKTSVSTDNNSMKMTKISKAMITNSIKKNSKSSRNNLETSKPKLKKIKRKSLKIKKKVKMLTNIFKTTLIISGKFNSIIKSNNNNKPHQKLTLITKSTDFKEKSPAKKTGSWKVKSKPDKDPPTVSFNTISNSTQESNILIKSPNKEILN